MTQQEDQDSRAFLEQLKCAASEADIEGMSLEVALCLTLLCGVRDARLKEKFYYYYYYFFKKGQLNNKRTQGDGTFVLSRAAHT